MNKKAYQKPAMQVVKIQHQGHLLAGTETGTPAEPGPQYAREQNSNWSSED